MCRPITDQDKLENKLVIVHPLTLFFGKQFDLRAIKTSVDESWL